MRRITASRGHVGKFANIDCSRNAWLQEIFMPSIACTARSMAPRRHDARIGQPPLRRRSIITIGGSTVVVCF